MKVFKSRTDLQKELEQLKFLNKTIGFVPTMGALHSGHIKLISESKKQNFATVSSIFVNPLQFNNNGDFVNYPVMHDKDIEKLQESGCDYVFIPDVKEIYPQKDERTFDLDGLDLHMEGKFRPGHFEGVVKVVSILFDIVKPNKAYFGEKDFQQLAVISFATKKYMPELSIEIVPVPTVRETDGLAMSSRNLRLTQIQRQHAPIIFEALCEIKNMKDKPVSFIRKYVFDKISQANELKPEYLEIVNPFDLKPVDYLKPDEKYRACIAVFAGEVRLIDNIEI